VIFQAETNVKEINQILIESRQASGEGKGADFSIMAKKDVPGKDKVARNTTIRFIERKPTDQFR